MLKYIIIKQYQQNEVVKQFNYVINNKIHFNENLKFFF